MATISGCYAKISKYQNLKAVLNNIVTKLNGFDSDSNSLLNDIDQCYSINNDNPNIYDRISNLRGQTNKTSNYLKNNVIPAIDSEIAYLRRLIEELEEAEREREAAAAAAASTK